MTGLNDDLRANSSMKDLAVYMRMALDKRAGVLLKFNTSLSRNEEVKERISRLGLASIS